MILPKLDYKKAKSLEEAIEYFEKSNGEAAYFAGGTDLIPRIKLRLRTPSLVIDLKGIEEMVGIKKTDEMYVIGANTTIFELKNSEIIRENLPTLYEACAQTSCEVLQMRGTIGGNILQDTRCLFYNKSLTWRRAKGFCYKMGGNVCHATGGKNVCYANYSSDLATALLSLGSKLVIVGKDGQRKCDFEEILTGKPEKPFNLRQGEIVKEIIIPGGKRQGAFEKIRIRGSIDYPLINGAFTMDSKGGKLVVGAIGSKPCVYSVETIEEERVKILSETVFNDLKPVNNTVVSPVYRKKMGKVIAIKLIEKTKKGA
ncbi:MAG: FAD binding domain-containing protein [Deltaproteobacteria bacterium]|nr:FAD binding domain-containing protein [Deltaproteobacteria bacterium]